MPSFKERMADILVKQGLVKAEQLKPLLQESAGPGKNFARVLVEHKLVSESALSEMMAKELGLPLISVLKYRMDPEVSRLIPERVARQYNVVPLAKLGDHLVVAMSDPMNIFAIDDLKALTQFKINPVLALEAEIRQVLDKAYAAPAPEVSDTLQDDGPESKLVQTAAEDIRIDGSGTEDAPVVRAINLIVAEAIRRRASDIHLEPMQEQVRVRYRVDGHLTEAHRLPKTIQGAVVARLKIMSGLDITEWRLPQDGRFKVRMDTRQIDFRVSILPISHGGKVVLRVLDKTSLSMGLDHLGFLPGSIALFKQAVKRPYGMILVTGPTGSGKSTTLYSVLSELNQPFRNIITIEDPVEYQVDGITQVQTNADVGLSFSGGLRALLRQSPDVVMIGEIRDFETADIAMKASLTGQMVLSTLHTNDAPSAVTRLIDMGVEPFLVASSVSLIEAQRLVRKLCQKCREPIKPPTDLLKEVNFTPPKDATFFRAVGCTTCGGKGFRGRVGIAEVLMIDDHIRDLIVRRVQSWEIKEYATKNVGMVPLREDGLKKAAMGVTSLEEVITATSEE